MWLATFSRLYYRKTWRALTHSYGNVRKNIADIQEARFTRRLEKPARSYRSNYRATSAADRKSAPSAAQMHNSNANGAPWAVWFYALLKLEGSASFSEDRARTILTDFSESIKSRRGSTALDLIPLERPRVLVNAKLPSDGIEINLWTNNIHPLFCATEIIFQQDSG